MTTNPKNTIPSQPLTSVQHASYLDQGFLVLPGLFDKEEMNLLHQVAKSERAMNEKAIGLADGSGGVSKLALWYKPEDNLFGMFSRCRRVVSTAEQLLGGPVYHYHSKMMLKEPLTGGAWNWHQDYGYWYEDGYLYPDMLSCLIAIDRATKENGCLKVIPGSQKMGNIRHVLTGDQTGADPARVELIQKVLPTVYCEMEPGTALFFHSNLLHSSEQNRSNNSRWSLISCYTAQHNLPCQITDSPMPQPVEVAPDSAIKEMGPVGFAADATFLKH